jgi:hypothetical protein
MVVFLHKNAHTTPLIRAGIASSPDSARGLAHRLLTRLSSVQETIVVYLRRSLLPPLDDLLAVRREFLYPDVPRSGLDHYLRRHGVGNFNDLKLNMPQVAPEVFKAYEPGYRHINDLPQMANKTAARAPRFLAALHAAYSIKFNLILSDDGEKFTGHLFAATERKKTDGMVERSNGSEDLKQILKRYVHFYNQQSPQSARCSRTPMGHERRVSNLPILVCAKATRSSGMWRLLVWRFLKLLIT